MLGQEQSKDRLVQSVASADGDAGRHHQTALGSSASQPDSPAKRLQTTTGADLPAQVFIGLVKRAYSYFLACHTVWQSCAVLA